MSNQVILVDKNDNEVGLEEKITAHKKNYFTELFQFFFLINHLRSYCRKELQINIIQEIRGQILAVVILYQTFHYLNQQKKDYLKKWVSKLN